MATLNSATLLPSNGTDALFRAWCTFIRDVFLLTGGWIQTSDTGQMNFTTVLTTTGPSTKQGYIIVRMNDTLQATNPVFVRIDFGSGAATATPGIWVTVGTGSDGTGNITNKRFDGGSITAATVTSGTTAVITPAHNSYGSVAPNRCQIALFILSTVRSLVFSIERTKDINGNDTGEGILFYYNNATTILNSMRYIVMTSITQPPAEAGIQYVLSSNNPSSFSGELGIGIPIPIKGFAQQPGYGIVIVRTNDFAPEAAFTVSVYGNNITYQHLNGMSCALPTGVSDSSTRICIRFD